MAHARTEQTYWNATAAAEGFLQLSGEISVDVAIIGLTAAVVEARRIGQQVTGGSTAKITSQHNLTYASLENSFGRPRALLYAEAIGGGTCRSPAARS